MTNPIYEIPVSELRPGLTVFKLDDKGVLRPDVYLADYFLGDYPPREFIYGHRLQFMTGTGHKVVWHNAGRVMVAHGRVTK